MGYCPACNAAPGAPCTVPTNNTRKPVTWTHYSREWVSETN